MYCYQKLEKKFESRQPPNTTTLLVQHISCALVVVIQCKLPNFLYYREPRQMLEDED
jgi:hypothetical protein